MKRAVEKGMRYEYSRHPHKPILGPEYGFLGFDGDRLKIEFENRKKNEERIL